MSILRKTAPLPRAGGSVGVAAACGAGCAGGALGTREEALRGVAGRLGGDHVVLPANLSDSEAVDGLVPRAVEALGKLDILVNNAGVTRDNLAMRMKDEEWTDVIRINLEAAFRLSRAALKPMMRADTAARLDHLGGRRHGNPGQANTRSKAASSGCRRRSLGGRQAQHHRELKRARFISRQ